MNMEDAHASLCTDARARRALHADCNAADVKRDSMEESSTREMSIAMKSPWTARAAMASSHAEVPSDRFWRGMDIATRGRGT